MQSILAKNYLMIHLLDAIFNFLLSCVLLFLQQRAVMSHLLDVVFNFLLNCVALSIATCGDVSSSLCGI
jgi:hypothetical protein